MARSGRLIIFLTLLSYAYNAIQILYLSLFLLFQLQGFITKYIKDKLQESNYHEEFIKRNLPSYTK